ITSVASESAFSSGGRLLDPHRSRLDYSTVEAMLCSRSWVREAWLRESEAAAAVVAMDGLFTGLSVHDSSVEDQENGVQELLNLDSPFSFDD
ncbi:unnamed protein product, partial [Linum tenue]